MPVNPHSYRTALVMFTSAMVVAACITGGWVWHSLNETMERRSARRLLLIDWHEVYSYFKDAETGVRGYLITSDESYLAPFTEASEKLPRLILRVIDAERGMPAGLSGPKLEKFQSVADDMMEKFQGLILVAQREGLPAAAELLKQGEAKADMDAFRVLAETRIATVEHLAAELDARMRADMLVGGTSILALGLAALVAGAVAWGMLRSVALQARKADRFQAERNKADKANQEKSTFLATMSHEIRTPMNAILGFGELLLTDAKDEKQRRFAGSIVHSGQALLQLINDILDLSKIEAGMIDLSTEPVNVRDIAEFTRQLFSHQSAARGVDLQVTVEDDVPSSLLLDGARLRQIVMNLVGNGLKFTRAGHVHVRFRGRKSSNSRSSYQLILEVEDTGSGIPADRHQDIFEPFVQAKANRDVELKGTGLGLAIVKRLTTLMGGTVSLRSEPDKGATFTVDVPHVELSARVASFALPEYVSVDFDQLRPSSILVVDDNPLNLSLIHGYFDGTQHRIATATNGREALDWLAENERPAVVLMDIRMPVLDGRTALGELRRRGELELLPVIAVTASSLSREESQLREEFDGYVRKPFSRAQLFAELAHFIPGRDTVREFTDEWAAARPVAAWAPLARRLRRMQESEWPAVQGGMVMSEISRFAASLGTLAQTSECQPLESYAAALLQQTENFAPDDLETTLAGFPAIIARIEQLAASAA